MGGGRLTGETGKATGKATVDATESNSVIIAYPAISLARYMANRRKKRRKTRKNNATLASQSRAENERACRSGTYKKPIRPFAIDFEQVRFGNAERVAPERDARAMHSAVQSYKYR